MSSSSNDRSAAVQKRMRKGTKSCLPCRKRKIRCSGTDVEDGSCIECNSRGVQCAAQGIVREDTAVENARLKAYISELESRRSPKRNHAVTMQTQQPADGDARRSLRSLLADVGSTPSNISEVPSRLTVDRPEEDLESAAAPLIRLLNNPVLGTTVHSSQEGNSGGPSDDHRRESRHPDHLDAVRDLGSCLPPEAEFNDILDNHSSWWPLYRETLGLVWGEVDCQSLRAFAVQALDSRHPSLLGILLTSLAISTGDLRRYLPAVERRIVNVDEYAGREYGLGCLMALGLCYIGSLQPRRAWAIYRRANALLQLNGLHVRRKSEKHELLFWQLFHADRWVSLMIGLPYCISDKFCSVSIPPISTTLSPGTWLYRHIALLTGKVIDCLQDVKGPTLAAVLQFEEQLDEIKAQLPAGYLDLSDIRMCADLTNKHTRLYRLVHFHQLRAHVHLPFLLRSAEQERYRFSRESCIDDSRRLLEAFLEIFDTDPASTAYGTVLNFTAFVAAVVVLMDVTCYRDVSAESASVRARADSDWRMLYRVMDAIKYGGTTKAAGLICRRCYTALEQLVSSTQSINENDQPKRVVLPYFGTLLISRPAAQYLEAAQGTKDHAQLSGMPVAQRGWRQGPNPDVPLNVSMADPTMGSNQGQMPGLSFTYNGPFLPEPEAAGYGSHLMAGSGFGWLDDFDVGTDWSWLTADLPPTVGM